MGYNAANLTEMGKIMLLAILMLFSVLAFSQDIIVKKNTDEIQVKIIEVGLTEIKYKNWNNQDGPTYVINKSDIFMIKYANGDKESFLDNSTTSFTYQDNEQTIDYPASVTYEYYPKAKSYLMINGQVASVEQSQQILGINTYRRLASNKVWEGIGWFFGIVGTSVFAAGFGLALDEERVGYNRYHPYVKEGVICMSSGLAAAGMGWALAIALPYKNASIVSSYNNTSFYNQNHRHVYLTTASRGVGISLHF